MRIFLLIFIFLFPSLSQAEIELVLYKPSINYDFFFLFPKEKGESSRVAFEDYLKALEKSPELKHYAEALRSEGPGFFFPWRKNPSKPVALCMTNTANSVVNDLGPSPTRMHRFLDFHAARGADTFNLLPLPTIHLSANEKAEARNLIRKNINLLIAPGSPNDVHPFTYGQQIRYATNSNLEFDIDHQGLIREVLNDTSPGRAFFYGVCLGCQQGCVVSGCSLAQDIEKEIPGAKAHRGFTPYMPRPHQITNLTSDPTSPAARVFGEDEKISAFFSAHHQSVIVPPKNDRVRIVALADETAPVTEMVEFISEDGRVNGLGTQFHPERHPRVLGDVRQRFDLVVNEEMNKSFFASRNFQSLPITRVLADGDACNSWYSRILKWPKK